MNPDVLLAKTQRKGQEAITLARHTKDVMSAAECLFGTSDGPARLGREWLRFFKIPSDSYPVFLANLIASAGLHDLGKANDGFQMDVRGKRGSQLLRHEHLSALMIGLDPVTRWLRSRAEIDVDLVISAVVSHHLKVRAEEFAPCSGAQRLIHLLADHDEFHALMGGVGARLGLPAPPAQIATSPFWGYPDENGQLLPGVFDIVRHREFVKRSRLRAFERQLRTDESRLRLLWAVRSALIAADAAGSGLVREGEDVPSWLRDTFSESKICTGEFVRTEIIDKRVEDLKQDKKKKWRGWSAFQDQCAELPDRALLMAPCGSGKTLAAWRWIEAQAKLRPVGHVLFLYPTRATAKEGFRDYVSWAPDADAALMHGTSEFDLRGMFGNPDDPRFGNRYEAEHRLFSLGFWSRRVFSATVDQFLAFLQYAYGPVCMLPVLADSIVVIDEVHSFNRPMLSALKDFLTRFDVPVLCMTATLTNSGREELERECGLQVYQERPGDLQTIADAPRYRIRRVAPHDVPALVRDALAGGKRVLWVVNQVRRAQCAFLDMAADFAPGDRDVPVHALPDLRLYCYHSRYKLADRVCRHNEVVDAFHGDCPAALAITTQVCEMSLDMDADLLVTEDCPITSLIQRMGRCNRARQPRALPDSGDVLVYAPANSAPYESDDVLGLGDFLNGLGDGAVSQTALEEALRDAPSPPPLGDAACRFVGASPYAFSAADDFRDIEEFTSPAVLQRDVAAFLTSEKARQPGMILPVPRRLRLDERPRGWPSYLAVAPDTHYNGAIGFCDQPVAAMMERAAR